MLYVVTLDIKPSASWHEEEIPRLTVSSFPGNELLPRFGVLQRMFPEGALVGAPAKHGRYKCSQRDQVLLCERVFLIAPLMQLHASRIRASDVPEEAHAVLRRPVTGAHHITASTWRRTPIHSRDCPGCIFASVVGDVDSRLSFLVCRSVALDQHDLADLAVLPKVLV